MASEERMGMSEAPAIEHPAAPEAPAAAAVAGGLQRGVVIIGGIVRALV